MNTKIVEGNFKAFFLHIPKTAGNYAKRTLNDLRVIGHGNLRKVTVEGPVLTIVRNPFDRLVSSYLWIMNGGIGNDIDNYQKSVLIKQCDGKFSELVRNLQNIVNDERMIHFLPQTRFVDRLSGNFKLHRVHFEALDEGLARFGATIISDFKPHKGKPFSTSRDENRCWYEEEWMQINVAEVFCQDFNEFGYDKNNIPDFLKGNSCSRR